MNAIPVNELIGIAVALVGSAFFSASETALTSLGRARIEQIVAKKPRTEALMRLWIDKPREILTTILIGNNIVNVTASALATAAAEKALSDVGGDSAFLQPIPVAIGVMTLLLLTFGEITPKVLARTNRERLAVFFMRGLKPCFYLFYPVVWIFVQLTELVSRITGSNGVMQPNVSEEDIEYLVHLGGEEGSISKDRRDLLESVFEFTDTSAREIMVPRTDIVALPSDVELDVLLETVLNAGHSRMPVYDEKIDEILGIVHVKDVFGTLRTLKDRDLFDVRKILRDAHFVPETKSIHQLMREMQELRTHMSVVVDEFGGVAGVVTLEDIIEEFFGEIWDEHDRETEANVQRIGDQTWRVDARTQLYDLGEICGVDFPDDADYDTVGGFIAKETGTVARIGTVVTRWGVRFEVVDADRRRIRRVRIERVDDEEQIGDAAEQGDNSNG